jgi:hypothetical protein
MTLSFDLAKERKKIIYSEKFKKSQEKNCLRLLMFYIGKIFCFKKINCTEITLKIKF